MEKELAGDLVHLEGEQPAIADWHATAETFAGRVRVEWDNEGQVTPLGQLPFFTDYLKQGGVFDGWVAVCPLTYSSPNAPSKRNAPTNGSSHISPFPVRS